MFLVTSWVEILKDSFWHLFLGCDAKIRQTDTLIDAHFDQRYNYSNDYTINTVSLLFIYTLRCWRSRLFVLLDLRQSIHSRSHRLWVSFSCQASQTLDDVLCWECRSWYQSQVDIFLKELTWMMIKVLKGDVSVFFVLFRKGEVELINGDYFSIIGKIVLEVL